MRQLGFLLGILVLTKIPPAGAQVPIEATQNVELRARALENSGAVKKILPGTKLRAVGRGTGDWIQVQDETGQRGWLRRSELKVSSGTKAATRRAAEPSDEEEIDAEAIGENSPDADPVDENFTEKRESFDARFDRFVIAKAGKFFESPLAVAERYSLLEEGDEVFILQRSPDKKWSRVRLKITGEEGWYPSVQVKVLKKESLKSQRSYNALSLEGIYGNQGYNGGLGLGYAFNFWPEGSESRPRDRLEFALHGAYFGGETLSRDVRSVSAKYYSYSGTLRYHYSSDDGFFGAGAEAGVNYTLARITNVGFSSEVLESEGLGKSASGIRFVTGGRGTIALSPSWIVYAGLRLFVSSGFYATVCGGLEFRF